MLMKAQDEVKISLVIQNLSEDTMEKGQLGLFAPPPAEGSTWHSGGLLQENILGLFRRDFLALGSYWHEKMNRLTWPERTRQHKHPGKDEFDMPLE